MGQEQILYVVIPCYNEEEVLKERTKKIQGSYLGKNTNKNRRMMLEKDTNKIQEMLKNNTNNTPLWNDSLKTPKNQECYPDLFGSDFLFAFFLSEHLQLQRILLNCFCFFGMFV